MSEWNKYQYSRFVNGGDEQYVVRSDDPEEFAKMVARVKSVSSIQAPIKQNSAPTSVDKPKVAYMWEGDACPVCNAGLMTKTVKVSKSGEKYTALVCDQPNCKGYAYLSKYPKKNDEPIIQIDDNESPF